MSAGPVAQVLSLNTKVVLLGLLNAVLMSAGAYFQKLNGVRGGNVALGPFVFAAIACYLPTFYLGNMVFAMGGKLSVYVPVTAASYALTVVVGRVFFHEHIGLMHGLGCALLLVGVALVARGGG